MLRADELRADELRESTEKPARIKSLLKAERQGLCPKASDRRNRAARKMDAIPAESRLPRAIQGPVQVDGAQTERRRKAKRDRMELLIGDRAARNDSRTRMAGGFAPELATQNRQRPGRQRRQRPRTGSGQGGAGMPEMIISCWRLDRECRAGYTQAAHPGFLFSSGLACRRGFVPDFRSGFRRTMRRATCGVFS